MQRLKKAAYPDTPLKKEDIVLLKKIKAETERHNLNNITRTEAYLSFYKFHPEIHWAFLAHMVSRNTGWHMTDLKGSLLPYLLAPDDCRAFYSFLERGNWLIFMDAYPQLLLYEESKKQKRKLFHLLKHFHVSVFMYDVWDYFFDHPSSSVLAVSLIINEQNHLEGHAMKNANFQANVFNNPAFAIQDLFSLNQILFPYIHDGNIELTGINVHRFKEVEKRISIGKSLYALLFNSPEYTKKVMEWANSQRHTASRKDFWPQLFNTVKTDCPAKLYIPRVQDCSIKKDAAKLYSPTLTAVWKNQQHAEPLPVEWYTYPEMVSHLSPVQNARVHDFRKEYCATLEKLELAIAGKSLLSNL